jgi:lysozyme
MNRVDVNVASEVIFHEALIRQTYRDSVGVLTWAVGMTSATGHSVSRYIGKPQTVDYCMRIFVWALKNYSAQVDKAFAGVSLTKAQYAAAVSFHWNTGAIGTATWVKHFKAGNMAAARKSFMAWNKPTEIIGRRKKECALFFDGVWANDGTCLEYTRVHAKTLTPIWGSAKRIDVRLSLHAAFATSSAPILDAEPRPDAPVLVPTLSVTHEVTDEPVVGFWAWLISLLKG